MDLGLIPLWVTSTGSVVGVVYAIVRNGSRSKKQDEQLKTELRMKIEDIGARLDDSETGLRAIKKSTEDIKLNCARVSTKICAQVETNQREIDNLRKRESIRGQ